MDIPNIDPNHCILTRQYAVFTPPIDEMVRQIGDWVELQNPGGFIYGASRLGKTRAVQWFLESVLQERFDEVVPLVVWNRREEAYTEATFWHAILKASKFRFVDPTKAPKRTAGAQLCLDRFISIAMNAGKNYVVLLIDEAQQVTLKEWLWLTGLQNELDHKGFLLSVFSIGTHQLGYNHEFLASTGNAHVAARFMTAHARFHGIRSLEEFGFVLNGYDEDSEWPPGSHTSFLQAFAPTAFGSGKRLQAQVEAGWRALLELRPRQAANVTEFPMQHIARTIEQMLKSLAKGESWDKVTGYKGWLEGLSKNNFSDHMRVISTAG